MARVAFIRVSMAAVVLLFMPTLYFVSSFCLSVFPSVCLSTCPVSTCLPVLCLSASLSVCLSVCLPPCLDRRLFRPSRTLTIVLYCMTPLEAPQALPRRLVTAAALVLRLVTRRYRSALRAAHEGVRLHGWHMLLAVHRLRVTPVNPLCTLRRLPP